MIRGLLLSATVVALVLAGCSEEAVSEVDALDRNLLAGNSAAPAADPVLLSALRDQIMVDPALVQQANADAVRPPPQPPTVQIPPDDIALAARRGPAERDAVTSAPPATKGCPQCVAARRALTLGALAEAQGGRVGECAATTRYSAGWANRLPAAAPLYPDARVLEAAGADGAGCHLRVVSFASATAMPRLIDWYYTKARAAGLTPQHQTDGAEHLLGATRPGTAMLVIMRPREGGGTEVDLMADGG